MASTDPDVAGSLGRRRSRQRDLICRECGRVVDVDDQDHPHDHGPDCGHEMVVHGDHPDYIHGGHRHAAHGAQYDEH